MLDVVVKYFSSWLQTIAPELGPCRRNEIDRSIEVVPKIAGLPTRPTRIRYKVDYANAQRTGSMTEKPAGRFGMGQRKEIQKRDGPSGEREKR